MDMPVQSTMRSRSGHPPSSPRPRPKIVARDVNVYYGESMR